MKLEDPVKKIFQTSSDGAFYESNHSSAASPNLLTITALSMFWLLAG
jgi:hypothetical protein